MLLGVRPDEYPYKYSKNSLRVHDLERCAEDARSGIALTVRRQQSSRGGLRGE
jgi:hypothetical protein